MYHDVSSKSTSQGNIALKGQYWYTLILSPGDQKGIMPPQVGMPHALNPRYPSLSELNIEIPAIPKDFGSVDQRPRRVLLNNFDAAVRSHQCVLIEFVDVVC